MPARSRPSSLALSSPTAFLSTLNLLDLMSSRLFIAIPTYGGLPAGAVGSLLKLVKCNALPMKLRTRDNDSAVCRARNYLTADFLESDCEKLLFIDSDIMFDPEQVRRIASHDEDVVGGFYPIKNDDPIVTWFVNHQKDGDGRPD